MTPSYMQKTTEIILSNAQNKKSNSKSVKKEVKRTKRCTLQTKKIRDIFGFIHNKIKNGNPVYGKLSERLKMSVLMPLFQPGVITKLKSADIRVDDSRFINGNVIVADFLLHIDIDKYMQYAKSINDDLLYPISRITSLIRPIDGTDAVCLTIMFRRKRLFNIIHKICEVFDKIWGIDTLYDVNNGLYNVTGMLVCMTNDNDKEKNSLASLMINDTVMRMNYKKLADPFGVADKLIIKTGIMMERMLYNTVNRKLNYMFEQNREQLIQSKCKEMTRHNEKSSMTERDNADMDLDSIDLTHKIYYRMKSIWRKTKDSAIRWLCD